MIVALTEFRTGSGTRRMGTTATLSMITWPAPLAAPWKSIVNRSESEGIPKGRAETSVIEYVIVQSFAVVWVTDEVKLSGPIKSWTVTWLMLNERPSLERTRMV